MRRVLTVLVCAVVGLAGTGLVAAPAEAASGVTLKKIADRQVTYLGSTIVKASYSTSGSVRISETAITVTNVGKTIAKSKPAVRLRAGTYTVGQRVTYRVKQSNGTYGAAKNVRASQSLTIRQSAKNCATRPDYDAVVTRVSRDAARGDSSVTVSTKLFSSGRRVYGPVTLAGLREEVVRQGRPTKDVDALIEAYGKDAEYAIKIYRLCATQRVAFVQFIEGFAVAKQVALPNA